VEKERDEKRRGEKKQRKKEERIIKIKKEKGFTLPELMTVLVIMVLLTLFSVPSYKHYLKQGRANAIQADLLFLSARLEQYRLAKESTLYSGAKAKEIYADTSPANASKAKFRLSIVLQNEGRTYLLNAKGLAGSEAEFDGVYWFNPKGKNCYFESVNSEYEKNCENGMEW